jgi:glycine betaine/choline ABC-type transport system substrate-binding protein
MLRKLIGILVIFLFVMTSVSVSVGCVGRVLYVGALTSSADRLMSQLLVTLINERTGTNVQIRFFDDRDQLYDAMKLTDEAERVDIIVEDTSQAMHLLKRQRLDDANQEYLMAKELYDKDLDIIWLNPFGFKKKSTEAAPAISAPLLRRDVLTNFPLLPRILNKLAGTIDDETFNDLVEKIGSGDKPKNVAKDFLRTKKLI